MGNCVTSFPEEYHNSEFVKAVKTCKYERVYKEGGFGAKLDQPINNIPILHYVILKGISELDNIMEYDSILAYLTCYTDLYAKKETFDLSINIDSDGRFHFWEESKEIGVPCDESDFIRINHTPAEFCVYLKNFFDSDNYITKTLEDWCKYFKSIEKNPKKILCNSSTYANILSNKCEDYVRPAEVVRSDGPAPPRIPEPNWAN